ncbi:MAG: dehydrogenase, partial [Acidobacteria bacterium]
MKRSKPCRTAFAIVTLAALAAAGWVACRPRKDADPAFDPKRGGLRPRESMAHMRLAPGFAVSLFASEPEVRQPVAMNWDDRGRMWVVEYLQYPEPAGLRAIEWDRYFRTKYDRVPEPPPRGPRGADRIKILEDTDGDGRADRVKVFVDGLNLASGVAVGYGGVFVAQAPYLLFYPDRNGDDKPDGPPEVLLEGFGMEDAHAVVNSLTWGPDGWQGIWCFHPRTREFELFAEGGGNTWSFDWDADGNLLCGTNFSNYAMLHMVQGGYYVKTFEKHGPLSNPYALGYFPHCEHRGPFKGLHVTIGGLTYQADAYPESFRGKHIAASILTNAVYWYDVERNGSTFATRHVGDLLVSDDPWFRPVDLTTGPDGAVYVADWYDIRATHNNTREDTWDKTSGRIYRIDYPRTRPARRKKLRLSEESSTELVARLEHPNEWFHREARRILAERRDPSLIPFLRQAVFRATTDHLALEYLWTLYTTGGFDDATAAGLLRHASAPVRTWTVRFLGDARRVSPGIAAELAALAAREPGVAVRSQLAATARRLPDTTALEILKPLLLRNEDASDPHIPLLVWWGLERHIPAKREELVRLLASPEAWRSDLVRRHLEERLARRLASSAAPEDLEGCGRLLDSAPDAEAADSVCRGMELGFAGVSFEQSPAPLGAPLARLWSRRAPSPTLVRLAARLGN